MSPAGYADKGQGRLSTASGRPLIVIPTSTCVGPAYDGRFLDSSP
jgi:hypothetical protein